MGAGETTKCEWTCPGPFHPVIHPRVGREPRGDGALGVARSLCHSKFMDAAG